MSHCARHNSAFSLIEVILAVAVFAMAATVLTNTFVTALLARERGVSSDLRSADIRAVRLQLLLEPVLEDAERGDRYETLTSGEANWRAIIRPMEVVDLFEVELEIEFRDPPEDQAAEYRETLYLLRPTWSDAADRSALLEDKRQELQRSRDFRRF